VHNSWMDNLGGSKTQKILVDEGSKLNKQTKVCFLHLEQTNRTIILNRNFKAKCYVTRSPDPFS